MLSLICTYSFSQEEQVTEVAQQEKNEIHLDQVPEAITKALAADYIGYSVGKVFTSSKNEQYIYTIQLSKNDDVIEVNYTTDGKVVQ